MWGIVEGDVKYVNDLRVCRDAKGAYLSHHFNLRDFCQTDWRAIFWHHQLALLNQTILLYSDYNVFLDTHKSELSTFNRFKLTVDLWAKLLFSTLVRDDYSVFSSVNNYIHYLLSLLFFSIDLHLLLFSSISLSLFLFTLLLLLSFLVDSHACES